MRNLRSSGYFRAPLVSRCCAPFSRSLVTECAVACKSTYALPGRGKALEAPMSPLGCAAAATT